MWSLLLKHKVTALRSGCQLVNEISHGTKTDIGRWFWDHIRVRFACWKFPCSLCPEMHFYGYFVSRGRDILLFQHSCFRQGVSKRLVSQTSWKCIPKKGFGGRGSWWWPDLHRYFTREMRKRDRYQVIFQCPFEIRNYFGVMYAFCSIIRVEDRRSHCDVAQSILKFVHSKTVIGISARQCVSVLSWLLQLSSFSTQTLSLPWEEAGTSLALTTHSTLPL